MTQAQSLATADLSYRLPRGDLADGVPALMQDLIARMVGDLQAREAPIARRAHEARKRTKRLRALLRLVRYVDADFYTMENTRFRDIAHMLAPLRETGAITETLDALVADYADQLAPDAFAGLRHDLDAHTKTVVGTGRDTKLTLDNAVANAHLGHAALWELDWPETKKGEAKALAKGIGAITARTRKAARAVEGGKTGSESLHRLRKAIKTQWLAGKLLRDLWPKSERPAQQKLRAAVDTLGPIHDIDDFLDTLAAHEPGSAREREAVSALLGQRRARLVTALSQLLPAIEPAKTSTEPKHVRATLRQAARH